MNIFLSHASEQAEIAEGVEVALRGEGHVVFRDRSSLPSGEAYHERIRTAIVESDLFLFLVSPESVSPGRYTITELDFAKERWSNPSNHILPVVVRPTDKAAIPAYLKAVTLLEPQGNLQAAVAAAVARLAAPPWRLFIRRWAAVLVVLVVATAIGVGVVVRRTMEQARVARDTAEIRDAGRLQHSSGDYAAAWDAYGRARALSPHDASIESEQERLAMDWLENIRVTVGKNTFSAIVEKVQPVLVRCAGSKDATRSADCLAHLGWGEYLRTRDDKTGADPVQHYRHALEVDPTNVYAHAMWGHLLRTSRRSMPEAKAQFDQALASGRERGYVRHLQIAALLSFPDAETENEVVRVANDMRINGETLAADSSAETGSDRGRLWDVYYRRILYRIDLESFLSALSPADHVATFHWLFPETEVRADRGNHYLFMLGTLQERAGDRPQALTTFRTIRDALTREGTLNAGGPLPDGTIAAVRRLSK